MEIYFVLILLMVMCVVFFSASLFSVSSESWSGCWFVFRRRVNLVSMEPDLSVTPTSTKREFSAVDLVRNNRVFFSLFLFSFFSICVKLAFNG
jgi:hypothetical protein